MKSVTKKTLMALLFAGLTLVILGGMYNTALAASGESTAANGNKGYTPLATLPGTTNSEGQVTIDSYIPGVFNLAIGIAGVLAVLMILIGGVEYITTDAIQGKSDGKSRINNALLGLVLVLVSWILLRTINPKLTDFDLTIKGTTATKSTETTSEYTGTGAPIASKDETVLSKNAEGYDVSTHTIINQYEDGTESYVITETYTDKGGNIYTTKTTKDKEDVFSTQRTVQYVGTDYETTLSED